MSKEILEGVRLVEKEKGIEPGTLLAAIEDALLAAYRKMPDARHLVRVDLTDRDESVWVRLGRFTGTDPDGEHHDVEDIEVVAAPQDEADAVVSGPADALDAWLWRRGDDSQVRVTGDRGIYDRFRIAVDHPIT